MLDNETEQIIFKHALKNASDYGKANPKAVLGKVLAEKPELKTNVKELENKILEVVNKVNSYEQGFIQQELKRYSFYQKPKEESLEDKLKLPFAERFISQGFKITTRFPPEPNGYLHIGHAKAAFLGFESAKIYKGDFVVRFDDTNPEKESQEYVDAILEDLEWLGIKYNKLFFASDYLDYIYSQIRKLFELKLAYVCSCTQEQIKTNRENKLECKCRLRTTEDNLDLFDKMLSNYFSKGEYCIRLVGNMKSENTAMRDPMLARIIYHEHYRQKDKHIVWPTYDLEAPLMDTFNKVTHAIRSKEYELRDEPYKYILNGLGQYLPEIVSISRLEINGYPMSKRIINSLINSKIVSSWDDIRLPTIKAIRKRGILPEAIKNVVLYFGFSKVDSKINMQRILDENNKIINDKAKRLYFVKDPVKAIIENLSEEKKSIDISLHPTNAALGTRRINVTNEVFISSSDVHLFDNNNVVRLKELANVQLVEKISEKEIVLRSMSTKVDSSKIKKIQWVSALPEEYLLCKITEPKELFFDQEMTQLNKESLVVHQGFTEKYSKELSLNEVIQFERFGFCKLDKIVDVSNQIELTFIYLSQ
ncbi:MAG: glutamate--tRNA ligase [Candidatus Micrarchaeota archaeon]|nr:glutamate--tRNA ligase [Candidatus Micrarchaeota archaeon]